MILRSASTNLILKSTNANKISLLMQLTKIVMDTLSVYLKKHVKEIFIGRT